MKQHKGRRFKQGAASFYMVAIATLVLVIIATSFAAIMIAEINRTSNDDLSQSAYDAAVAGVEDARLAYYNYKNCVKSGSGDCEKYIGDDKCNSFVRELGRGDNESEVKVQEGSGNDMDQAYTCTKIDLGSYDYLSSLNDENPTRVVKIKLADGKHAADINAVKMSWGVNGETVEKVEDLPTLEVGLLQTGGDTFTMDSFDMTKRGETTNRGTVFLEPTSGDNGIVKIGVDDGDPNGFLKSNDKTVENTPYQVQCNGESEPQCSVVIALPEPVDGHRNDDTFMLMWSKIGGADSYRNIDVKMELCDDNNCTVESEESGSEDSRVRLDMQVVIDSTGRANDLYRRVEVRLEKEDTGSQRIYALMADSITKEVATCENNFEAHNCK